MEIVLEISSEAGPSNWGLKVGNQNWSLQSWGSWHSRYIVSKCRVQLHNSLALIISDSGIMLANILKIFKHTLVMWKNCASHLISKLNWVMQLYHTTCSWLLCPSYGLYNVKYPWNQATFMLRLFDPERTNAFYTQPSEINPWNGICANLTPTTGGYATIFYDYSVTNS